MGIHYSIPVKVISNNGAIKCTIPKQIADKIGLTKEDQIIWILYDDGHVEVQKEMVK